MGYDQELTVAFMPWCGSTRDVAALQDRLTQGLAGKQTGGPTFARIPRGLLVGRLSTDGLLSAIDIGARGRAWALIILFEPQPMPIRMVDRLLPKAQRRPTGLLVRLDPRRPRAGLIDTVLQLHAALLRARSEATWRAVDARRRHRTHTAAAVELGCSMQAVSKHVREGHLEATAGTRAVLAALLKSPEPQAVRSDGVGGRGPSTWQPPALEVRVDPQPSAVEETPDFVDFHNPLRLGPFTAMFTDDSADPTADG
ncbi:MAG: hypothetical protein Q7T55_26430 [Solirubrobacteraceae bacterium]|nr:hypothetical protein [Solirubrobacteraceae bacterium]